MTPAFAKRGVMLDISRNKVPTMATLCALVDLLAEWHINHLQLYTEHTFAYPGQEAIWGESSPMTASEVQALDAYCRERGIELAANQNSLGHLTRWLSHPDYAHLAETLGEYVTPWGERRPGPFSLNPANPAALTFLAGLYDALLPNFTSPLFNIGCDEAFDLGQGLSRDACLRRGKGRVYLDYLLNVRALVEARGRTMMFWGDIILKYPELIRELGGDVVALVWGYEADHPFDDECRQFAQAGLPFWVCPGTSAWKSIGGRLDNALANIQNATDAGRAHGAYGMLLTEWGDDGHWQTWPVTIMALAAGAEAAWSGKVPDKTTLAARFEEGMRVVAMGNIYKEAGFPLHNASPLFALLHDDEPSVILDRWTDGALQRAQHALARINRPRQNTDTPVTLIAAECDLAAAMMAHAVRRGQWIRAGRPATDAGALRDDVVRLRDELARLWLLRNRPGGLTESLAPLLARAAEYEAAITPD